MTEQPSAGPAGDDAAKALAGPADGALAPPQRVVASGVLTKSTESFKVLTECPLIVMLLFQLYPRYIQSTIPSLIPVMVQTLALRPPRGGARLRLACADFMAAQVKTLSFLTYLLRAFADFMRPYQESIPKCVIQLLLMCPPESASIRKDILVATRHILATDFRVGFFSQIDVLLEEKVLIGSGSSSSARSSHETLRPLACSTLADLVHHVRSELGMKHLSRVVYIFSCNIHDASLPLSIQTTSVRLLLNLVENIFHKNDAEGRALLVRILHCLVCKFATLKVQIATQLDETKAKALEDAKGDGKAEADAPKLLAGDKGEGGGETSGGGGGEGAATDVVKTEKPATDKPASAADKLEDKGAEGPAAAKEGEAAAKEGEAKEADEKKEDKDKDKDVKPAESSSSALADPKAMAVLEKAKAPDSAKGSDKGADKKTGTETKEVKQMLKTMILGVKTVVWSVSNSRMTVQQPHPMAGNVAGGQMHHQLQKGMSEAECLLVARLLKSGLECFAIYNSGPDASAQEEKDVLDYFAGVFTVLDVRNFTQVFQLQMPFLYARVLKNATMSTMLQHFLANSTVSRSFADILLTFLVERIEALGSPEEPQAAVLLRLFKLVFGSITLFPENEPLLRPHLNTIVTQAMRHAAHAAQPANHFSLLRALFKSIGGGKFEQLYKEFLPLLPALLQGLIGAHAASHLPQVRELLLELCLTLPARLSSLLPYLHMLMRPVLHALRASPELVSLALRTLEFWIDHLHPGFLAPLLSPVMRSLLLALTKQLQPAPYPFGAVALRILGKLGGRNRQYLHLREPLPCTATAAPLFAVTIPPSLPPAVGGRPSALRLPLDAPLARALELLQSGGRTARAPPPTPPSSSSSAAANAAANAANAAADAPLKEAFALVRACACRLVAAASEAASLDAVPPAAGGVSGMEVDAGAGWAVEVVGAKELPADAVAKGGDRYEGEEAMLKTISQAVALASATPSLTEEAGPLLTGLARHMGLLVLHTPTPLLFGLPPAGMRLAARPRIFIDGVLAAMGTSALASLPDLVLGALTMVLDTVQAGSAAAGKGAALATELTDHLFHALRHLCYTCDAPCKKSALQGLRVLFERQPASWTLSHEVDLCSALLHLCEDQARPDDAAAASALLAAAIKACHGPAAPPELAPDGAAVAKALSERLTSSLSACSGGTREAAKAGLKVLAGLLGKTVGDLLLALRDSHLVPLLARKLRSLALPAQVAITEAVCFCLKESPRGEGATEVLPLGPPLLSLLGEALMSAEGEEAGREKPRLLGPHARGVSLDVRLRVVSIELLCAAMPSDRLKTPPHSELRGRMIACFFKSLTVRSDEVVAVARDALAYVIDAMKEKLQKELLQTSLRPILLNLADYRKLSVPLLLGLSRLLSLLSNFFNLTLGEKLLEHLRRWTDPETVNKAKAFKPGDEIKIPGAILSLFHLLPPAPNKFLDQLVTVTMDLDAGLPGSAAGGRFWSHYREALLPYINRHAPEAVAYFLDRLNDTRYFRMLLSYLKCPDAAPVRTELANCSAKLLLVTFQPEHAAATAAAAAAASAAANNSAPAATPPPPPQISPAKAAELRVQGIVLVHALVKRTPGWLSDHPPVLAKLVELWQAPERKQRLAQEEHTPLEQLGESKLLVKCFVSYCRFHAQPGKPLGERQVELLFLMLTLTLTLTLALALALALTLTLTLTSGRWSCSS